VNNTARRCLAVKKFQYRAICGDKSHQILRESLKTTKKRNILIMRCEVNAATMLIMNAMINVSFLFHNYLVTSVRLLHQRMGSLELCLFIYYGGRAPSHKNPDWLMQQKTTKKKGRPLKFLFHRSKLQAGSFNDDYHAKPHLIHAITCPRP
jgi:hypothetical protein